MARSGVVSVLLVAAFALSGCVGSSPGPAGSSSAATAPPPTVTEETGSIEGRVLNEENLPVENARVGILEVSITVQTDAAGRFVINELAPATYKVFIERIGYQSAARSVDVVAGDVAQVDIVLVAIAIAEEALRVLTQYDGIVQCSASIYTPINPCGGVTGEDKDSWIFEIDRTMPFEEGVFELVWKATGPGPVGEQMELEVCDDLNREYLCTLGGTTSEYYRWADGPSPQVLHLTDMPKAKSQFLTGAGAAFQQAPLVQQRFTIYMTLCYYEECGEEYSALPPP